MYRSECTVSLRNKETNWAAIYSLRMANFSSTPGCSFEGQPNRIPATVSSRAPTPPAMCACVSENAAEPVRQEQSAATSSEHISEKTVVSE